MEKPFRLRSEDTFSGGKAEFLPTTIAPLDHGGVFRLSEKGRSGYLEKMRRISIIIAWTSSSIGEKRKREICRHAAIKKKKASLLGLEKASTTKRKKNEKIRVLRKISLPFQEKALTSF